MLENWVFHLSGSDVVIATVVHNPVCDFVVAEEKELKSCYIEEIDNSILIDKDHLNKPVSLPKTARQLRREKKRAEKRRNKKTRKGNRDPYGGKRADPYGEDTIGDLDFFQEKKSYGVKTFGKHAQKGFTRKTFNY